MSERERESNFIEIWPQLLESQSSTHILSRNRVKNRKFKTVCLAKTLCANCECFQFNGLSACVIFFRRLLPNTWLHAYLSNINVTINIQVEQKKNLLFADKMNIVERKIWKFDFCIVDEATNAKNVKSIYYTIAIFTSWPIKWPSKKLASAKAEKGTFLSCFLFFARSVPLSFVIEHFIAIYQF